MNPNRIREVLVGNQPMTVDDFVAIARFGAKITLTETLCDRVMKSRGLVEKFLKEERVIYGLTTGFGANCDKIIAPADAVTLQKNIIRSHACSVGEPLEKEVVRGIMLMMILNMGRGYSGVQLETLKTLAEMLNKDVTPRAPGQGSVGYLAIEAHISLVLMGEGFAWVCEKLLPGHEALAEAGISPIELGCKEGLALVSGTTSVTALTTLAVYDSKKAADTADIIGAISLQALKGTKKAFDPRLMSVRPHEDQGKVARNILRILEESEIADKYENYRLQDALSLRCMPQLHGAAKKTIRDAETVVITEMNSCCDNPIIFPEGEDGVALMGCNADSAYVGIEADSICIALTNLAKMSERRIDRLVNPLVSELPAFLIKKAGLNSGMMIPQYAAAGLLGEMRIFSTASTIDNTPTCGNQEDYVAMGYNAARKAYKSARLLEQILAIELLNGVQALEFHHPLKPSPCTEKVVELVRKQVPSLEDDLYLYPYIEYIHELIRYGEIKKCVEDCIGTLEN